MYNSAITSQAFGELMVYTVKFAAGPVNTNTRLETGGEQESKKEKKVK
jgi:hypothetical protein